VNATAFGLCATASACVRRPFRRWGTAFRLRPTGVSAYNQDVRSRSARFATRDQESPMKLVRYSVRGSSPRLGALPGDRLRPPGPRARPPPRARGGPYPRPPGGGGAARGGARPPALSPPSARGFPRAGAAAEAALPAMEGAVRAGRLEWHTHPAAEAHLHAPI